MPEIFCPGCQNIITCTCMRRYPLSCTCSKTNIINHKNNCDKFWKLDDTNQCIHQWCLDLSKDRYDVWLLNKKYETTFFYSVNHNTCKELWLLPLDELQKCLLIRKKADLIYENENILIYVKYINVLTREDKVKLKESLVDYWAKNFNKTT